MPNDYEALKKQLRAQPPTTTFFGEVLPEHAADALLKSAQTGRAIVYTINEPKAR